MFGPPRPHHHHDHHAKTIEDRVSLGPKGRDAFTQTRLVPTFGVSAGPKVRFGVFRFFFFMVFFRFFMGFFRFFRIFLVFFLGFFGFF